MRFARIIGALGVAAFLIAMVPVTGQAATSPYTRMDKVRKGGSMMHHPMMHHHHHMMHKKMK